MDTTVGYAVDESTVPAVRPVERPQRLLAGWIETQRPADAREHKHRYGPLPVRAFTGRAGRATLIQAIEESGLTGRGGAGFPTGRKLRAVAAGGKRPIVVANGCEGEPISEKDHALLMVAPHLVLDGAVLAAHAVHADEVIVCVERGDPLAATVRAAAAARVGDPMPIDVVEVPSRFVSSEASALVNFLNTGDARPTSKPPHIYERGVRGRPTLVDNVETLAHLALIARYGPAWFRERGTAAEPGTALMTVSGAVRRPGVHELSRGAPLVDALTAAGDVTEPLQAVLVGGFGGGWLPWPSMAGLPLTHGDFRSVGAALGVGIVVALPVAACGLVETARILGYLAGESAGQCGPCMFGLPAIAEDFRALAHSGAPAAQALDRLRRRLGLLSGRGACAHPDGAAHLAVSALRVFEADVQAHAGGYGCQWSAAPPRIPVPRGPLAEGWQ